MGFCYVGQTVLELLTSGDPPASASQSAGITGVCHWDFDVLKAPSALRLSAYSLGFYEDTSYHI